MAPAATSELTTIPAVVSRFGGPLEGEDSLTDTTLRAPETPTGHDILVNVKAVSVNPVDVKIRAGAGGPTDDRVLGWDASGVVLAIGDAVAGYQSGDQVYYAGALGSPGTYAKQHLVDERIVGRKPATLSHAEAAALPLTTITAWEALFDKLKLDASSTGTLLVLGAAGGVGSIMIQLAKSLTGVKVIATASRDESRAWVKELGADAVVDHSAADFEEQVLREAPGGVDYVFTPQSKGRMQFFAAVTRPFGQIVAIDDEKDLDFMALKSKSISWHWEFMFARPMHGWDLEAQRELLDKVSELIDAGALRTTLTKVYSPIDADQLRKAHADVETGHAVGKIVVAEEA